MENLTSNPNSIIKEKIKELLVEAKDVLDEDDLKQQITVMVEHFVDDEAEQEQMKQELLDFLKSL